MTLSRTPSLCLKTSHKTWRGTATRRTLNRLKSISSCFKDSLNLYWQFSKTQALLVTCFHIVNLVTFDIEPEAEPSQAEPSRAEPSQAKPSWAKPSRAEPSQAKPSQAEPSRAEPSQDKPHFVFGFCNEPDPCPAKSKSHKQRELDITHIFSEWPPRHYLQMIYENGHFAQNFEGRNISA